MLDQVAKKLDETEQKYTESKVKLREKKDIYEVVKAKQRVIIRTRFTVEGRKITLQEIEDELLIEQNNIGTELGKAFIDYTIALAQKEVAYTEKKRWERRYWDEKQI